MTIQSPPQAPPLFAYSPEDLLSQTEQLIARNKELVDNIVKNVSVEKAEFSNVLLPFVQGRSTMSLDMNVIGFLRSVSSDASIREASASAEKTFSDYTTESSMREYLYLLVEAVYYKQKDDAALEAESRFLLEKEYKAYGRMGFGLPPCKRNRLREIKKRLPELYIAFSKNLEEHKGGIWFTPEELGGVPDDFLETLEKGQQSSENEGKLRLTFKPTDLSPAQKYCTVPETRKRLFLGNENQCRQNLVLLQEAIKPSLLKHGEVVTMFHELGHGIHNLVSQTKYGRPHGTNTTRDEALHMDVSKLFNKLRHDLCMLDDLGDADDYHWAHGAAIFSHIMGGYDVGVYGYLTSQVYATDMFRTFCSKDLMSKEAGRRYRDIVLKPGGSREPMALFREFLGREPSTEAFCKELGIA